jgi:Condensation domain/Phosphopantetheine attachment site
MSDQAREQSVWYGATPAQQGIWILDRIERLRPAYLIPSVLEFSGPVDHVLLVSAVRQALGRHPVLRSVFRLNVRRRQVEYRTDAAPPLVRFADTPAGGWVREDLDRRVLDRCYAPFDLAAEAPARAEVIRVDDAATLLVLTVHHIVFDGWSRRLLVAEIAEIYQAALLGREPELAEPGHPADLPGAAPEAELATRISAITDRLRDAPIGVPLPYDRPPVGESPLVSDVAAIRFDAELTGRLLAAAAGEGCTAFMAGVALLAGTLARASAQRDFLFAVVWPGRDDPAVHGAVGMLMNTVALRVGLGEHTTWRELLRNARTGAIDAFVDGDVPLAPIAAALDADRDVSRPPLTPVLINLAEVPPCVDLAPGVRGRYRPLELMYSIWDLILFVHVDGGCGRARLELSADYATDLFDRTTITDLLEALRRSALDLTKSLEDPVLKPTSAEIDFDDPAARLELVRSVWREVLATDDIDDDTGFFDAGGNSLLLVALVEELSRAAGRTFKTMEVFRAGSIEGQAELLATAGDAVGGRQR